MNEKEISAEDLYLLRESIQKMRTSSVLGYKIQMTNDFWCNISDYLNNKVDWIEYNNQCFGLKVKNTNLLNNQKIESHLFSLVTKTKYANYGKLFDLEYKGYTFDLRESYLEIIARLISFILSDKNKIKNYSWLEPLQTLYLEKKFSVKQKKEKYKINKPKQKAVSASIKSPWYVPLEEDIPMDLPPMDTTVTFKTVKMSDVLPTLDVKNASNEENW